MAFLPTIVKNAFAFVQPFRLGPRGPENKRRKGTAYADKAQKPRSRPTKRKDSEELPEVMSKRRRVDQSHYTPIVNGKEYESTAISTTLTSSPAQDGSVHSRHDPDRMRMPPPSLTPLKARPVKIFNQERERVRNSVEPDSTSQASLPTKATRQRQSQVVDEYNMEKARRHAAATTLPNNSGIWERGEQDLFYHLAYRGFEPLLPANWMRDFPTLPLSLYAAQDDQIPLIKHHQTREFRAIRELRELFDLGKNVRDKVLSSPSTKLEVVIERAVNKYTSWALNDAGIYLPSLSKPTKDATNTMTPIHVVVSLKSGQSPSDCLFELKNKLHVLAARHRQNRNIQASVENSNTSMNDPTRFAGSDENDLPVLYGLMICRSILAVFTMNSQTPPSKNIASNGQRKPNIVSQPNRPNGTTNKHKTLAKFLMSRHEKNGDSMDNQNDEDDSASDPRFISDFDFSDPARDVWNALVIAIVAMQIREDMILLAGGKRDEKGMVTIERRTENLNSSQLEIEDNDDSDG